MKILAAHVVVDDNGFGLALALAHALANGIALAPAIARALWCRVVYYRPLNLNKSFGHFHHFAKCPKPFLNLFKLFQISIDSDFGGCRTATLARISAWRDTVAQGSGPGDERAPLGSHPAPAKIWRKFNTRSPETKWLRTTTNYQPTYLHLNFSTYCSEQILVEDHRPDHHLH